MKNPAEVYRRTSTQTSSPAQLVVMLYRGAIRFLRQAVEAIDQKDVPGAHHASIRAQAIVLELRSALRPEVGPVAQSLDALYDYFIRRLVEANVNKDREATLEVVHMLESLLEAWETALASPLATVQVHRPTIDVSQ